MLDYVMGCTRPLLDRQDFICNKWSVQGCLRLLGGADNAKIGTLSAGNDEPSLYGRRTMCFINNEGVSPMSRKFIHVLIAR